MTVKPDAHATISPEPAWPCLATADRFARDMLAAAPHALVVAGRTRQIGTLNTQAERMFGYDYQELQGKPLEMLFPPRLRGEPADSHQQFITNLGVPKDGRGLFGLRKDGSEFPLQIQITAIDIAGEPSVMAAIIDLTTRHEIAVEQEKQRRELARSNADLEEFGYAASHDLKAPLRAISHLAQWISEDISDTANAETLENIKLLKARVRRMETLLDGLLAYSRVSDTKSTVAEVDTADVIREIVGLLGPPPGFTVTCEGKMPVIQTNFHALQVVLENLIGNALKHHDRAEGQVRISARAVEGATEFRVSDDGPGIAPEYHDRIFLMFQTLASRDSVEASGIGLTIVKKKVDQNGGEIWVESAPPARGTTFAFTWK